LKEERRGGVYHENTRAICLVISDVHSFVVVTRAGLTVELKKKGGRGVRGAL
jgi:hypothetical protein